MRDQPGEAERGEQQRPGPCPQIRRERHDLRASLAWAGFGPVQGGLWIAPGVPDVTHLLAGHVRVFRGTADPSTDIAEMIAGAYDLPALAARYEEDATLVIFHTSVLYQVPAPRRQAFTELVRRLPAQWISVEGPEVLPAGDLPDPPDETVHNVLALNGRPLAWARPHGQGLAWFG